jgi:hypothetical protein
VKRSACNGVFGNQRLCSAESCCDSTSTCKVVSGAEAEAEAEAVAVAMAAGDSEEG